MLTLPYLFCLPLNTTHSHWMEFKSEYPALTCCVSWHRGLPTRSASSLIVQLQHWRHRTLLPHNSWLCPTDRMSTNTQEEHLYSFSCNALVWIVLNVHRTHSIGIQNRRGKLPGLVRKIRQACWWYSRSIYVTSQAPNPPISFCAATHENICFCFVFRVFFSFLLISVFVRDLLVSY